MPLEQEQNQPVLLCLQNASYMKIDSIACDEHSEIWFVQKSDTNEKYVIKIMDIHRSFDFMREVRVLERLQGHQNIIRLFDKDNRVGKYYMVLEMGGIDLAGYIQKNGTLDEESAKAMFVQMLDALAHCHSNHICHHDLKLENFLFDKTTHTVKLIDFGFSVDLNTSSLMVPSSSIFTSTSPSPSSDSSSASSPSPSPSPCSSSSSSSEIISGRFDWCTPLYASKQVLHQENHHFEKTDIFSLGICLYYMLCGRFPFCTEDDEFETLLTNIRTMDIGSIVDGSMQGSGQEISPHAKDLLKNMLASNESDRCDLNFVYNHPWLFSANVEYMTF